ncbi:MAG: (2Fe-2S)-binding protein [Dehalococcoidia bacterium]
MKQTITLSVNGKGYEIAIEPYRTLLDVLRNELGLTGTKRGCDSGDCGACTVLLDGRAVTSCLVLAMDARDCDIITIEGLARGGELHPLQRAFIEHGALQCGYCTPGAILSAKALLDENPSPSQDEVRSALVGNLCRCTGYEKIVEAILAVAQGKGKDR